MAQSRSINFPTFLTLLRLILSPLVLPVLFVYLLPFNIFWFNCSLAALFIFFSLTDFFDGYFARKLGQETTVGRVLDPIADKFFIYSTLIALLAVGKIYFYWVIILIGREFFVMGLRQISLEHGFSIRVAATGKLKTMLQMIYLTVVIVNPYQGAGFSGSAGMWNLIEWALLIGTLFATLISARHYFRVFMKKFSVILAQEKKQDNKVDA